ncbi:MAG: DNA/RNA helicase domain-containing protein [Microcella pacifica]
MVDPEQSVRPADLPPELMRALVDDAKADHRHYPLTSQLRVRAGEDYIGWVRSILRPGPPLPDAPPPAPRTFEGYDLRFFDDLGELHDAIRERDAEHGLARLVAGYAWEWKSKNDPAAYDIELDGRQLRWNTTATDWIASPTSLDEVGSIHTVQGYDLNYAGVIIGNDLQWDEDAQRLVVDRDSYFDKKGKENNPVLGRTYSDEDLLRYICNVYAVLMTRGIRGTYLHVVDDALRRRLSPLVA